MSKKNFDQQQEPKDAFLELGVNPDATFEQIQNARDRKLEEAGEDLLLKAKIESSYDSLLMNSLKERREGKISNEAVSASKKEKNGILVNNSGIKSKFLSGFSLINSSKDSDREQASSFSTALPQGDGLTTRISLGLLMIVILLVSTDRNIQLILSVSTIGLFISQLKRGRKIIQSLGWSVVFLSSGYILGGLIVSGVSSSNAQYLAISLDKLEALPVLILLLIGSLF